MSFIIVFSLFVPLIFQIVVSLFGMEYLGSEDSPLYQIAVVGSNALVIAYVACYEFFNWKKARRQAWWPYLIPLIVAFLYALESIGTLLGPEAQKTFKYFYAFSCAAIVAGAYTYRYNKFDKIAKNLELLMLICAISLAVSLPKIAMLGLADRVSIGGGNHQTISYTAAVAFGTLLCGLVRKYNFKRYFFANWKIYKVISIILLPILAVICIIGGGRGGAVLLIINMVLLGYIYARKHIIQLILASAAIFWLLSFAANQGFFGLDMMMEKGFDRSFAYITDGGIDMHKGSSNRDVVYDVAGRLISARGAYGYGLFNQYDICQEEIRQPYFHNIFLETLVQGGILYAALWLYLLVRICFREKRFVSEDNVYYFLIPITSFPLIMLQFSGTYMFTPTLWFVLVFVLGKKIPRNQMFFSAVKPFG